MRTTDFSKAPVQARAGAILVAEQVRGSGESPHSVARRARVERGFVWHKRFRRGGPGGDRRVGVIVCFETAADAESFAATLNRPPRATFTANSSPLELRPPVKEGWIARVLNAEPSGYSNGVWRAEANVMAHIEHFTPTSVEQAHGATPPRVATPGSSRSHPSSGHTEHELRPLSDAHAMFIGATKYRGLGSWLVLSRTWYPMVVRMKHLRGYVWHTVYWEAPFTLGTLAFFGTRDELLSFARLPAHRQLMQWITAGTRNGTGGYIRIHTSLPDAPAEAASPGVASSETEPAPASPPGGDDR
ncbi:hypothetical protein KPL76_01740 [Subtercola sp. PAMC28395]|uniref:hypothetical protein n=1 Tax=Subtercola sp. PAMC28395 TaxID=2846775 RepID=UPI001C0C14DD|nr:hypothetical protein [Subtercola sp. PAMC28395]QWT24180.1 hypothetical protein KPL76_01740 [Subtercola sp. PAMC28395]